MRSAPCPVDVKSEITGIRWPGLFRERARSVLVNLLFQLEQSQWWAAEQLREHQFRQLGALLRHAVKSVPYYREHGGYSGLPATGPVPESAWEQLPILNRSDLQQHFEELKSRRLPAEHGRTSEVSSSGSTGTPVRVLKSQVGQQFVRAVAMRDQLWHRRDLRKKFVTIRTQKSAAEAAYPAGAAYTAWSGLGSAFVSGPSAKLNLNAKVHEQAEWLMRQKADYLLSYPSILEALARYCRDEQVAFPPMLELGSMAETLRPEVRRICREVWGAEIKDIYSTEETGYIALQCPCSEQLLVQAEVAFVEILDQNNRPCAAGETGRVVVTPLHNFAMPLIRYEVGDLAVAGGKAACGRGLPVLERVLGRSRNLIRFPDGSEQFPDYQDILLGFGQVRQFQIIQKSLTQLEMKLVSPKRLSAADEDHLRKWIRERFRHPFAVEFTYHSEIPRTRGGKYLDFVSEL